MWTLVLSRRHAGRSMAVLALVAGGLTGASAGTASAGAALAGAVLAGTASAGVGRAVQVRSPAGALANPVAALAGVSCATTASCAAGGQYDNAFGGNGMVTTGSSTRWARASAVRLPGDAEAMSDAAVAGVSCVSPGTCTAVGSYITKLGARAGLITSLARGRWSRAIKPVLPKNARVDASASLFGVSCPKTGSCVSVGTYLTASSNTLSMAVSQSRGQWHRATEILPPRPALAAEPFFVLRSVACTAVGRCVAAGTYLDQLSNEQGAVATLSNGHWGRAVKLPVPSGALAAPDIIVDAIACTGPGSCVVSGSYRSPPGLREAMIVTESGGHWHATRIAPPPGANSNLAATLASVACTRTGFCEAVGTYNTARFQQAAMRADESGGRWRQAGTVNLPRGAATGAQAISSLFGVSCVPKRGCVAVGNYLTKGLATEAMAVSLPAP